MSRISDRAAHHRLYDLVLSDVARRAIKGNAAVAQDTHPVGKREHFVEPVGDVENGDAASRKTPNQLEEFACLRVREGRGRLVENNAFRGAYRGAGDLDDLPFAQPQRGDLRLQWKFGAKHFQGLSCQFAHGPVIDEPGPRRPCTEQNVLRHRERRRIGDLLGDQTDSRRARISHTAKGGNGAVHRDRAAVGHVVSGQDPHECGLAGPVLPQKGGNRSCRQIEVHAMENLDLAERFPDAAYGEEIRRHLQANSG